MNFRVYERRERRSLLNQSLGFGSIGYTIANYSTDAVVDKKIDMKPFEEEILNTINCIPDPLRKNLADTVITSEKTMEKPEKVPPDPSDFYYPSDFEPEASKNQNIYTSLQGISTFFSNFFGAITGSVFSRRARSPVTEYYDCYDSPNCNKEMAPHNWQTSSMQDLNKNSAPEQGCELNENMNNYRTAVAQCEQKLNVVKGLLPSKNVVAPPKFRRKPRKMFVEPGMVQENAEDTFSNDHYVSLPNGEFIEYVSVCSNLNNGLAEIKGGKMKTEVVLQGDSIVNDLTETKAEGTMIDEKLKVFKVEDNEIVKHLPESEVRAHITEVKTEKADLNQLIKPTTVINGSDQTPDNSVTLAVDIVKPISLETNIEGPSSSTKPEHTINIESKTNDINVLDTLVTEKLETSTDIETSIAQTTINEKLETLSTKTDISDKVIKNISEVSKDITEPKVESSESELKSDNNKIGITKEELISSVEDKMAKLKLLFQEKKRKTHTKPTGRDLVQVPIENTHKSVEAIPPTKVTITEASKDKKFRNHHRLIDKRKNSKLRQNILEDMKFAHEIDSEDLSSVENSPRHSNHLKIPQRKCTRLQKLVNSNDTLSDSSKSPNDEYFDELKGRFHTSSTTESEDSFQIVFTDSPKYRRPSDCESEDSFIIFEDPDSCYTTNDVFGDHETTESEFSDSEVSDSGCDAVSKLKLSQNMSRTVSDLTNDSLYEDVRNTDEIDCAVRSFEEIASRNINVAPEKTISKSEATSKSQVLKNPAKSEKNLVLDISSPIPDISSSKLDTTSEQCQEMEVESQNDENSQENVSEVDSDSVIDSVKHGLLLDEERKRLKKNQPKKSVSFSSQPPKVHVMRVWAFAARQARAGHWERHAVDRERFKRRIADTDMAVSWVLKPQHRRRIMFQRFMPWWNHLKRLQIAETKRLKEEEEQRKKEEEERRIKDEEERRIKDEEERIIREEEERVKEQEILLKEEEPKEAEGIVNNKEENTNGITEDNDKLKTANVKPKIKNTNYNKPMSAYLKQNKKIVLKNPNTNLKNNVNLSNEVPKPINIDDIVVGQHNNNNTTVKKPIINIDDIVVGKHNTNKTLVKSTGQNMNHNAVAKPINIEDFIGKSNQNTVKVVTQKLSEKIVNGAKK